MKKNKDHTIKDKQEKCSSPLPKAPLDSPAVSEVKVYFLQKEMTDNEAEHFFLFYQKRRWLNPKQQPFKSWKPLAYRWIAGILKREPWRFNRSIH